jgi:hypothetical protein
MTQIALQNDGTDDGWKLPEGLDASEIVNFKIVLVRGSKAIVSDETFTSFKSEIAPSFLLA